MHLCGSGSVSPVASVLHTVTPLLPQTKGVDLVSFWVSTEARFSPGHLSKDAAKIARMLRGIA